jgi:hypothetical protein
MAFTMHLGSPSVHERVQLWDSYSQTSSSLTKFIVNNIDVYVSKQIYYENVTNIFLIIIR